MPLGLDELEDLPIDVAPIAVAPIADQDDTAQQESAGVAATSKAGCSSPVVRKTRGPAKRDADTEVVPNTRVKLEFDDGFVPQECRGFDSGRVHGHNGCKTYEESTACAVDFTLVPSPASGDSGHAEDNGRVIIKCTRSLTEPCGGNST